MISIKQLLFFPILLLSINLCQAEIKFDKNQPVSQINKNVDNITFVEKVFNANVDDAKKMFLKFFKAYEITLNSISDDKIIYNIGENGKPNSLLHQTKIDLLFSRGIEVNITTNNEDKIAEINISGLESKDNNSKKIIDSLGFFKWNIIYDEGKSGFYDKGKIACILNSFVYEVNGESKVSYSTYFCLKETLNIINNGNKNILDSTLTPSTNANLFIQNVIAGFKNNGINYLFKEPTSIYLNVDGKDSTYIIGASIVFDQGVVLELTTNYKNELINFSINTNDPLTQSTIRQKLKLNKWKARENAKKEIFVYEFGNIYTYSNIKSMDLYFNVMYPIGETANRLKNAKVFTIDKATELAYTTDDVEFFDKAYRNYPALWSNFDFLSNSLQPSTNTSSFNFDSVYYYHKIQNKTFTFLYKTKNDSLVVFNIRPYSYFEENKKTKTLKFWIQTRDEAFLNTFFQEYKKSEANQFFDYTTYMDKKEYKEIYFYDKNQMAINENRASAEQVAKAEKRRLEREEQNAANERKYQRDSKKIDDIFSIGNTLIQSLKKQ